MKKSKQTPPKKATKGFFSTVARLAHTSVDPYISLIVSRGQSMSSFGNDLIYVWTVCVLLNSAAAVALSKPSTIKTLMDTSMLDVVSLS